MFARILALPFLVTGVIFLYLTFEKGDQYSYYVLPFLLMFAVIYIFSPQLNWWWHKRYPPEIPIPIRHSFNTQFPFYQNLSPEDKTRFRNRVALYFEANEFMPQGAEKMPIDVQASIAASIVWLTFGLEDFLLNKFEHLIVYRHPFPSPQYPKHWHSSEYYVEDGVIMFSADHLMKGFFDPKKYFHTGLYEYARVFQYSYPNEAYPEFGEDVWAKIEQISGFKKEGLEEWIGLPKVDIYAICVVLFFVFPKRFQAQLPKAYEAFEQIFKQSPAS